MKIALVALALVIAGAASSLAQAPNQRRVPASPLAGVTFPQPSLAWTGDAGPREASLTAAARWAGRSCGEREYYIWPATAEDDDMTLATEKGIEAAFTSANWVVVTAQELGIGNRVKLLKRDDKELVLAWVPMQTGVALLVCAAQPLVDRSEAAPAVAPQTARPAATNGSRPSDPNQPFPWFGVAAGGLGVVMVVVVGAMIAGSAGARKRRTAQASPPKGGAAGA